MERKTLLIRFLTFSFFVTTAMVVAPTSSAQESGSSKAIESLRKCQLIQRDTERLTCYDESVSALTGAVKSKDILVIDKSEIVEAQKDNFGKSQSPSTQLRKIIEKEDIADEVETPKELVSVIAKVENMPRNRKRFHLENGQIWDQIESKMIHISKKNQATAHIKKAALGSFRLRVNGKGSPIRVKRIK